MSCPVLRQPWDEEWIVAGQRSELRITASGVENTRVLTIDGLLDETTYVPLRDAIVKTALDEPLAVIIDVTRLTVRDDPAWAVFTSARWQIAEWPDIPIGMVCAHDQGQNALRRNGITRYVPAYPTVESAITELAADGLRRYRRRVAASLPAAETSIHGSRELVAQWLTAWSRSDFIHAVSIVASELVEMALVDSDSALSLRVETNGSTVAVAVQHVDVGNAGRREFIGDSVSSLDLVAANCRVWGSYTSAAGNTVWAVVGPENRF
jgi:STAS domain-containing protein